MEDAAGHADEWDDEDQLKRIDHGVADLRGGYVETEDKGEREAEDGRAAEKGIDADEQADGHAPCQSLR